MTAEEINKYIKHFKRIYKNGKEINPLPVGIKITAYVDNGKDVQGFIYNATTAEMGIYPLIAQEWILQSDLEKLVKNKSIINK